MRSLVVWFCHANFGPMEKRSRLGRGLSSLLNSGRDEAEPTVGFQPPTAAAATPDMLPAAHSTKVDEIVPGKLASGEVFHVELSLIAANPNQPRRTFDEVSLRSLAESIKSAGIIQPIIVREVEDHYEVIAGERRWRAAKLAQLTQIPVIIRRIDSIQRSQIALIENIHREDLNPLERAMAYQAILRETGFTHQELATKLGEERSSVANYLRLVDLPKPVQDQVAAGQLSFGHAKLLAGIDNPAEQERLANLAVYKQMSVRNLEKLIQDAKASSPPAAAKLTTPHIADLERRISRDLQMRAELKQSAKGKKGKLVLHYASLDQFDELLHRLGIKVDD